MTMLLISLKNYLSNQPVQAEMAPIFACIYICQYVSDQTKNDRDLKLVHTLPVSISNFF